MTDPIALALSGGGFRATLFHLGSLWRLNELGLLPRLKSISSVSGGAITGCFLGLKWRDLRFDGNGVAMNLQDQVVEPLRKFCSKRIDLGPSLANMAAMLFGAATSALPATYRNHLFGSHTLQDLPAEKEGPVFIFLASNLQTGGRVWFSRERMYEDRLGSVDSPTIPLARVVAASSAFPPFLSPVILKTDPAKWKREPGCDLYDEMNLRRRLVLTDGGVHDPSGVDPIFGDHETILVSDANVTKEVWRRPTSFWIRQTGRSTIMQTVANRAVRRELLTKGESSDKTVVWWTNADSIDDHGLDDPLTHDSDSTRALGAMRTTLDRFTPTEQARLINWGYALCDAALRTHLLTEIPRPTWPIPEHAL